MNEEVLSMVETHVMNSDDKAKCISDKVPLTYVYGPAKSNEHFIKVGTIVMGGGWGWAG